MEKYMKKKVIHLYPLESFMSIFAIYFLLFNVLMLLICYFLKEYNEEILSDLVGNFILIRFWQVNLVLATALILYNFILQYFFHKETIIDEEGIKFSIKRKNKSIIKYEDIINIIETRNPYLVIIYNDNNVQRKIIIFSNSKEKIYDSHRLISENCHFLDK